MNVIKMKKIYLNLFVMLILILGIVLISNKEESISTASGNSNQKIEWGIKRNNNHEQPDVGNENKKILEENNGICLGNEEQKFIYLTFDEGYEAGYTNQILDILKENDVKAAFF